MFCLKGLSNWTRREFQQFVKANEKYGRHDLENIAKEIDTKTPAEVSFWWLFLELKHFFLFVCFLIFSNFQVEEYAKLFWERFEDLTDHERILATIEKACSLAILSDFNISCFMLLL